MSKDSAAAKSSRPSTIGLQKGAKSLIRNVLRHTDTHNRLLEESEMWQVYQRLKQASEIVAEDSTKKKAADMERVKDKKTPSSEEQGKSFKEPDIHNSFLYDDRKDMRLEDGFRRGRKRAHMDDSEEERRNAAASSKSTYWMRELQKTEETDPDRWGHAGFKELYPDAFNSDRSLTDDGRSSRHKSKKKKHLKKRHKHKSVPKKKKRKRLDSDPIEKNKTKRTSYKDGRSKEKKRKKRRRYNDDNSSGSSSDSMWIERKTKEVKCGSEISESDDDSEDDSGKRRGRRNIKTEGEREKKPTSPDRHWSRKRRK